MKRAFIFVLFVMVVMFGTVACFASKLIEEKLLNSLDIESVLFSNCEKSMEARNMMMDELLVYFEKSGVIKEENGKVLTLAEKEEKVNSCFDILENTESTNSAIFEMESKVQEIGVKYEKKLSENVGRLFADGKVPDGMEENEENVIIGGDVYFNKSQPENALLIVNAAREKEGLPKLSRGEIAKRGFYCSQSAFMWSNAKWEGGKIKYRIAGSVSKEEELMILECMKKWEEASGGEIKFVRYRNNFWNKFRWKYCLSRHVQISIDQNIGNSWATLGEQVRAQIHLDSEYFVKRADGSFAFDKEVIESEILHEMGHALTLFHEHQRADRDKYVTVNYERAAIVNSWTLDKAKSQYGKITMYDQKFTKEYDTDSIMQYWSSQSNEKGERDIVTADGEVIFRAMDLSEKDKEFIKELYMENADK